jgi:hypothetical protein
MPPVNRESPADDPPPQDRVPSPCGCCCLAGLIVAFEACALLVAVWMGWLLLHYILTRDHKAAPPTAQAARMLQYWATLLLVHALAFAWFRRAPSARSGLLGFAGIVYLGCGYVFSLTLSSIFELWRWPEDVQMVLWTAVLPIVAWLSALLGCCLLLRSLMQREWMDGRESVRGLQSLGLSTAMPTTAYAPSDSLHCPALTRLLGLSLLMAAGLTGLVLWRAAGLMDAWYHRQTAERSGDYLGVILYAVAYLTASLVVLCAALITGRRALRRNDPELLWLSGALAVVGGLQHLPLLGLSAVWGGLLALRAANRNCPRPHGTFWDAMRQSWGRGVCRAQRK